MSEFNHELGLIALESCKELGDAVDKYIQNKRNFDKTYLIPTNEVRFSNGEGKVKISESVEEKIFTYYVILEIIAAHIKCSVLQITKVQMSISKTLKELYQL